jgi:hypothetical protein
MPEEHTQTALLTGAAGGFGFEFDDFVGGGDGIGHVA